MKFSFFSKTNSDPTAEHRYSSSNPVRFEDFKYKMLCDTNIKLKNIDKIWRDKYMII